MEFKNITEAFECLYREIIDEGFEYQNTKALFNKSFTVLDTTEKETLTKKRKFNKNYAELEWEWYIKGDRNVEELSKIASLWKNMIVPNTINEVNSNYGYFWNKNNQLNKLISELNFNENSRRAILVHYDINELDRYKYDTPCNVVLNFYIKDGTINLTVFARSIDLVYGLCNDFYTFCNLLEIVSLLTFKKQGSMHWFITNLHVYEKHYNLLN